MDECSDKELTIFCSFEHDLSETEQRNFSILLQLLEPRIVWRLPEETIPSWVASHPKTCKYWLHLLEGSGEEDEHTVCYRNIDVVIVAKCLDKIAKQGEF